MVWVQSGRGNDGKVSALINFIRIVDQVVLFVWIVLIHAVSINPQVLDTKRNAHGHCVHDSLRYVVKNTGGVDLLFRRLSAPDVTEASIRHRRVDRQEPSLCAVNNL